METKNNTQLENLEFNKIQQESDDDKHILPPNMKEFIINHMDELFIENLPSDTLKELPPKCKY